MKLHNNPIMRTVFRVVYVLILLSVIVLLIANDVVSKHKDNEWLMWLILGAGFILMFVIEDFLCRKFPEVFPTTKKEKEFMQIIDEISKEGEKDEADSHVVLPRTLVGTLCELATIGIIAYAMYRALTLDQRLIGIIGLSVLALALLFGAYYPNILKKQLDDLSDMKASLAISDKSRVRALFGALVIAYFPKWMGNAGNFKNDRQVLLDIRRHRIYAVAFALLALVIPFIPDANDKVLGVIYVVVIIALSFALSSRKIVQAGEPEQTTTD